jgi:hypothetical protein
MSGITSKDLLKLYQSFGGRLPWGTNPKSLLVSESQRAEQGKRLSLLIEQEKQAGRPNITDNDLLRLAHALGLNARR